MLRDRVWPYYSIGSFLSVDPVGSEYCSVVPDPFFHRKTTAEYTMPGRRGAAPHSEFGSGRRRRVSDRVEAFCIRQGRYAMAWCTNAITALPALEKIHALGFSLFREWYVCTITTQRHPQDTRNADGMMKRTKILEHQ